MAKYARKWFVLQLFQSEFIVWGYLKNSPKTNSAALIFYWIDLLRTPENIIVSLFSIQNAPDG